MRIEARFGPDGRAVMIEADEWHPEAELEPWLATFERLVQAIARRPCDVRLPAERESSDVPAG